MEGKTKALQKTIKNYETRYKIMFEAKGFKGLEKKFGIKVVSEGVHFNPLTNRTSETFKIYSADKCKWENGLSRAGVKKECEKWARQLLEIKEKVETARS